MKLILPSYYELFSYQNLFNSYLKARKGKRHKKDVIDFELNTANNIWELKKQLDNKAYKIEKYNKFIIYEPKEREINSLPFKDRVVQHCVVDYFLAPLLKRHLIYDNAACQKGKGTDFARKRLISFLHKFAKKHSNNGYVLKIDIKHYFASISHKILKDLLNKIIEDIEICKLLSSIIDSFEDSPGYGLPLGNQTSQCFALFYLNKIDRIIKEKYRIKFYVRYMDDLIIINEDKDLLRKLLIEIKEMFQDIKLSINKRKTNIFKLTNHPIQFLGFNYNLLKTGKVIIKVINDKLHRSIRHVKKLEGIRRQEFIVSYSSYLRYRESSYYKKKTFESIIA